MLEVKKPGISLLTLAFKEEGFFVGLSAVCAECGGKIRVSNYAENEIEHVADHFRQAVLEKRNGNNRIEIYSWD